MRVDHVFLNAAAHARAVKGVRGFAVERHAHHAHVGGVAAGAAAGPELLRVEGAGYFKKSHARWSAQAHGPFA